MDDFLLSILFLTLTIIHFLSDKNEVISDRRDQALNCRALLLAKLLLAKLLLAELFCACPNSCCSVEPPKFVLGVLDVKFGFSFVLQR